MRIVAGQHKGRPIQAPDTNATRPTSDRARESLFNVLAHADWAPPLDGARVMDVFAGSGALGLEAVSRGAGFCLFVDTAAAARASIRQNIETLGLFGVTRIHRRDATKLGDIPAGLGRPFSIVFLDPPYRKNLITPCLESLRTGDWLAGDALIVVEAAADENPDFAGFSVISDRSTGAAKVWFVKPD